MTPSVTSNETQPPTPNPSGVPRGAWGVKPPREIPKDLQNRAKLNRIVKTAKNCWIWDANTPRRSEKRQIYLGSHLFYISNDKQIGCHRKKL